MSVLRGLLSQVQMSDRSDTWKWELDPNGSFSVCGTRRHIDSFILQEGVIGTRWWNLVPIKVNVFI